MRSKDKPIWLMLVSFNLNVIQSRAPASSSSLLTCLLECVELADKIKLCLEAKLAANFVYSVSMFLINGWFKAETIFDESIES